MVPASEQVARDSDQFVILHGIGEAPVSGTPIREVDEAILGAYLAGANTRRIRKTWDWRSDAHLRRAPESEILTICADAESQLGGESTGTDR